MEKILLVRSIYSHFANFAFLVISDEDVPGRQVSVDKGLAGEIVHAFSHLQTELGQQSSSV